MLNSSSPYIYAEFLVEDASGAFLVEHIIRKYITRKGRSFDYKVRNFSGIGKLPKYQDVNPAAVKKKGLLNNLPSLIYGLCKSLDSMPYRTAIFVLLDCDNSNCADFKQALKKACVSTCQTPVYFCIAIEEMEAWLLGDEHAILNVYPHAKRNLLAKYANDSIIGTWEYLAEVIYPGGLKRLKSESSGYFEIGKQKCEWSDRIGRVMDLSKNQSPSFNYFISKLDCL